MPDKTHSTAVVLIPPREVWEPIQQIRRRHDRQVRRWMPHVTLLYPFRPREEFAVLGARLSEACRTIEPFTVTLAEFHWFEHAGGSRTFWLAPERAGPVIALQQAIQAAVPDCDDVAAFPRGFTPHLSVGQARSDDELRRILQSVQAFWQPLSFKVERIHLLARGTPPQDVFEVVESLRLGA